MTRDRPPRPLTRLLEALLPSGPVGDSISGDLMEEWHGRPPGARRTLWYLRVASGLALRYGGVRVLSVVSGLGRAAADAGRATATALRRLRRAPLRNALTVAALGIGIAAPATMFSIVQGLTRDSDVERPERLVHVGARFDANRIRATRLDWLRPVLDVEGFRAAGLYSRGSADLSGGEGPPERHPVALVSSGFFAAVGVEPLFGRVFDDAHATDADPGNRAGPVLLGEALWRERFGADRDIVGRGVRVNGTPRTVIGVLPERLREPGGARLWLPLDPDDPARADLALHEAVGRLADGASLEAVRERVRSINARLRARGDTVPPARGVAAESWRDSQIAPHHRRMLSAMVLVVGFVLVIACADVLNLLLARALGRVRETAVRVALGADRLRVAGEHLAEALALALAGGAVGLGLTAAAVRAFEAGTVDFVAHWMDFRLDLPVLFFGAAMVALAAALTGLLPAIQAGRVDVRRALADGGRGSSPFRLGRIARGLVVAEVALSCALLAVAGIMVRGAVETLASEGDFATRSVLTARYELGRVQHPDPADRLDFHRDLVERLEAHPGVAAAAVTTALPGLPPTLRAVEIEGRTYARPDERPSVTVTFASPELLDALDRRVLRGRNPRWSEGADEPPAALVNRAFAEAHLGGRDPIGARVRIAPASPAPADTAGWATVVGLAPALAADVGREGDGAALYLPIAAEPARGVSLLVRAAPGVEPLSLARDVREAAVGLDRDLALFEIDTLEGQIAVARAGEAIFAVLFVAFGLAGLVLAAVGLYGMLAFSVRRRLRDLGVRTALGARPVRLLGSALGRGLAQLGAGVAIGLGLAALIAPLLGDALLGADPRDPLVYGAVAAVVALTGLAAVVVPARRVLGVDVMRVLRTE